LLASELSDVRSELREYLERLGLQVEEKKGGSLLATRRTALAQESLEFRVVGKPPARLARNVRFILPPGRAGGDVEGHCQTLDDFLDSTIQADRLAQEILADPEIARELKFFIPQRVSETGSLLPVNALDYLASWLQDRSERLLVVLAPAGYGKTLLTRVFAHRLAGAHLESSENPLPFLLPFGQFRRVAEFEGMILSAIQRKGITDFTAAAFAFLVQKQRCVLMLDGFDELLEERPEEAQKNLRELIETLSGQGRVVVTARSTFFRTSTDVADFLEHYLSEEDVTILDLEPFDSGQRRELVQRLSPNQKVISAINGILENEGLREAMGSPLLLRETVEALTHATARSRLSARSRRKDIFGVLEASVYGRERERHGHKFPDRVQREFLDQLAGEMLQANVRGFEMEGVQVLAAEAADAYGFVAAESDLARLADHHFVTADRDSNDVRFNHQVFREYFQASALAEAVKDGGPDWVINVLSARPLPEEVAAFLAELEGPDFVAKLLQCVGPLNHGSTKYLVTNIWLLCAAFQSRPAIISLLNTIDPTIPLGFRVHGIDLSETDWKGRVLDGMEFVSCDLSRAKFDNAAIRDVAFQNCVLAGTSFYNAVPDSVQFDYGSRLFGTTTVVDALRQREAAGLEAEQEMLGDLAQDWRDHVRTLIASRLKRFYIPGTGGDSKGSRWDVSILEMNLLGGLNQFDRRFAVSELIPTLVKAGVLSRVREHGNVVYRLRDEAKDDARRLIEEEKASGLIETAFKRLEVA
jgi:hypothetical protein